MSSPSPLSNDSLSPSAPEAERPSRLSVKEPLQCAGFWAAVALPFAHVGLLVHGLTGTTVAAAFVALLAANVLALYVGHGYKQ